jgi:IS30 family transposase
VSQIAKRIGRNKSSISRELRRNSNQTIYNPQTACNRYLVRRERPWLLDSDAELRTYVLDRLYEGFSPETISLRLKKTGHIEKIRYINYESIYAWLYRGPQKKQKLYKLLTQKHARRGRRKKVHRGMIQHRISIHERDPSINDRNQIGHWEADLMSFQGNKQHMMVIHERKTRYTAAIKLQSKRAEETFNALLSFFKQLPKHLRTTVTFDNGTEFSLHHKLTDHLGMKTFFCDVYASWQKGGIENMNGRLRRDLPRKTNLLSMREEDLEQILLGHNIMPRKVLNGKSPIEALAAHLGKVILFSFRQCVALRS